jgi:type IV secretory pathway protease TraF
MLVAIASGRTTEARSDEAAFWKPQKLKFLRHCITLLLMAGEPVQLLNIYRTLSSAPQDLEQVDKRAWQDGSYLYSLLLKADQQSPDHPEWPMIKTYWLTESSSISFDGRYFDPIPCACIQSVVVPVCTR